jgi:hypothetical protein
VSLCSAVFTCLLTGLLHCCCTERCGTQLPRKVQVRPAARPWRPSKRSGGAALSPPEPRDRCLCASGPELSRSAYSLLATVPEPTNKTHLRILPPLDRCVGLRFICRAAANRMAYTKKRGHGLPRGMSETAISLMTGVLGYFGLWTAFLRASHPTRVVSAYVRSLISATGEDR